MLEHTRKLMTLKAVYASAPSAYITLMMADKSLEIGKVNEECQSIVDSFVPAMQLVCQNHRIITKMTMQFIDELYAETFSVQASADAVLELLKKYQNAMMTFATMNNINIEIAEEELKNNGC